MAVGTITRPALFMVIALNANYKLLLGHKWIHGFGVVPSNLHQRVAKWCPENIVENIKGNQSYYKVDVNKVGRKHFDQIFANIAPCYEAKVVYTCEENATHFLNLNPNYGFIWDKEDAVDLITEVGGNPPTGWTMINKEDH